MRHFPVFILYINLARTIVDSLKIAPRLPIPISKFIPLPGQNNIQIDAHFDNPFKANLRTRSEAGGKFINLLNGIDSRATLSTEGCPEGAAFVSWSFPDANSVHDVVLGQLPQPSKFMCHSRIKRWWMAPSFGSDADQIPVETQLLLLEIGKAPSNPLFPGGTPSVFGKESQVFSNKEYAVVIPLIDFSNGFRGTLFGDPSRHSTLQPDGKGWLALRMESGDPSVKTDRVTNGLYVATGRDPYQLLENAYATIARETRSFRTRADKPPPPGIDSFGFCTWDAFYSSVDTGKVTSAIQSLSDIGFSPKFVIIDDGWQSTAPQKSYRSADKAVGDGDLSGAQIDGSVALQSAADSNPLLKFVTKEILRFYSEKVEKGKPDSLAVKLWAKVSHTILKNRLLDFFALNTDFSKRLTSWKANSKFEDVSTGRSLKDFVRRLKEGMGVRQVFVWHALSGYWGGISEEASDEFPSMLSASEVEVKYSSPTPHLLLVEPALAWDPGSLAGVGSVAVESLSAMYERMHRYLADAGIDGVKVDAQSGIGAFGTGNGGGATFARNVVRAAEDSVRSAFNFTPPAVPTTFLQSIYYRLFPSRKERGKGPATETPLALVGCMCHSTENLLNFRETSLIRASDDFYPRDRASHTVHLVSCAYNSVMLGEIAVADWDMFHSKHDAALIHAAARAISGGPVYVSDVPGHHDPQLLKRLVLPNGEILRTIQPAKPTLDCLFTDVMRDHVSALKIFSLNGGGGGVIGAFNVQGASWDRSLRKYVQHNLLPGRVKAEIQPKLLGEAFVASDRSDATGKFISWEVLAQKLSLLSSKNAVTAIEVAARSCEVFAISHVLRRVQYTSVFSKMPPVPVDWSPIGLIDMFNPGGAIVEVQSSSNYYEGKFIVRGAGRLGIYASVAPSMIKVNGRKTAFEYSSDGLLTLELEGDIVDKPVSITW